MNNVDDGKEGKNTKSDEAKERPRNPRGVFEKPTGSGIWWICYFDANGKKRREKVGSKSNAIKLYQKRKTEILQGKKLPETLRRPVYRFSTIAEDARKYCDANNSGKKFDGYRIERLKEKFGNCPADLPVEDVRRWFDSQVRWKDATYNRYRTMLSLIFRLANEHGKATTNPARLLKRKHEHNGRVRFLGQFTPAETELDFLKPHTDEESRLRAVIERKYPDHMPEFLIALHTGMRPSEQYGLTWDRVDLVRKQISLLKTKNGNARYIPLNPVALGAFQELFGRSKGDGRVFIGKNGDPLKGYKHWFEDAVEVSGVKDFTWYCLRHTFASRLVMAGVDLRTVAELMGHKAIQMTMRYAHLAPAHKQAAVDRLAGVQLHSTAESSDRVDEQSGKTSDTRTDTSGFNVVAIASKSIQ